MILPRTETPCSREASSSAPPWTGLFDLFRIGIGPSSSHTVGPMIAARRFRSDIPCDMAVSSIGVELFGSLALTGKGHATDVAVVLGLLGERPDTVEPDRVPGLVRSAAEARELLLPDGRKAAFDPAADIAFVREMLPRHPNALRFTARGDGVAFSATYYSLGGGFVVLEDEEGHGTTDVRVVPYPFTTSREMLDMASAAGVSVAELQRCNELAHRSRAEVSEGVARIWAAMRACVSRGLGQAGELPGGLRVRRRAPGLHERLRAREGSNQRDVLQGMDWVNLFALAVNEENAAGGRVVTAPTNGAAGIIPAVLHYYDRFVEGATPEGVETGLSHLRFAELGKEACEERIVQGSTIELAFH